MAKDKGASPPNLTIVAGAVGNAKPAPKVGRKQHADPGFDDHQLELPTLPAGCPIEPLGKLGQTHFFLDEAKQLISLPPKEINKNNILSMFGRRWKLCHEFWPRFSDKTGQDGKPIITGWKPEAAGELLMGACALAGIFDPQGKVRGTGAHRADDGELVLHCGDQIFITGGRGYAYPGKIGEYVYPAGPSRPRPHQDPEGTGSAEALLMTLRAWSWQRPEIDPMLLLGHIGCSMIGGALEWRPHAWITGGTATGKSTLQKLLRAIHGGAALTTGNATEAGLRQLLKQQTLPVFFDELEATADNRKAQAVVELARVASSGDQVLKGSQNHEGAEFTVRSCFLFSSIKLPPMPTQDKNRLAVLELDPLSDLEIDGKAPKPPTIDMDELKVIGTKLRRRLTDHWHRLDELVDKYKTALGAKGHTGRSGDQFGTLLALADVMLYDVAEDENILFWAHELRAETLAEKVTEVADEEAVIQRLATSYFPKMRGGDDPAPIARVIHQALQPDGGKARERLEDIGLRIVEKKDGFDKDGNAVIGARSPNRGTAAADLYLAIANNHVGLAAIYENTEWNEGGWSQSFSRVRFKVMGAGDVEIVRKAVRRVKVRFGPNKLAWSTLIPLPAILELGSVD